VLLVQTQAVIQFTYLHVVHRIKRAKRIRRRRRRDPPAALPAALPAQTDKWIWV
jgi:hypothetical protein